MTRKLMFLLIASILLFTILSGAVYSQECSSECAGKICVAYFYSPTCSACNSIKDFMSEVEQKYSENITLHRLNVKEAENFEIYSNICTVKNLSLENRGIPLIVTKDSFLMGTKEIRENIENDIETLIKGNKTGCLDFNICHAGTNATTNNMQNIITLPLIVVAAAADAINPCAIGVLIFLIGFLLLSSGKNYKKTIKVAAIYIFTVYVAYFLAGLGILEILTKLSFLKSITKIFAVGIGILGLINIKDALQNKTKGTLAIPGRAKPLIEKWVYKASIPAAIVLGIIVASVELPCTGGMYLAILTLMANSITKSAAIGYLLIYNFIFVLPLIIITLLFVRGFEAEKLQTWMEKHKKKSRMIMGVVLLAVGVILFFL